MILKKRSKDSIDPQKTAMGSFACLDSLISSLTFVFRAVTKKWSSVVSEKGARKLQSNSTALASFLSLMPNSMNPYSYSGITFDSMTHGSVKPPPSMMVTLFPTRNGIFPTSME